MLKSLLFIALVLWSSLIWEVQSYTWLAQTLYATESCASGGIQSVLLTEMDKCFQVSDTSSTATTCTTSGNTITKVISTWTNNECSGAATGETTYTYSNSACSNGLTFECTTDPEMENWPGIGTWQPSVDNNAGETCAYQAGPQYVETVPTTCQTDGVSTSWKYILTSSTLEYREYYSTTCTGTVISSSTNDLNVCENYNSIYSYPNPVKGYAASTINAIAGTGFLTFNTILPQGNINNTTIGVGAAVGVAIGVVLMCVISCLLGYWCILHYDLSQKNVKQTDVTGNDVELGDMENGKSVGGSGPGGEGGGGHQHNAAQENGIWTVLWGFATCTCCYEEFM